MIGLLAVAALTGLVSGGLLARRRNKNVRAGLRAAASVSLDRSAAGGTPGAEARLRGFPCGLGDVVLLAHGEEAWLSGAALFRERTAQRDEAGDAERTVAALFFGPDKGGDRVVYARPRPNETLDWMWPLSPEAVILGTEPPSVIEHEGQRFERVRRIPLSVVLIGEGAPELGAAAVLAEYEGGAGARLLVVVGAGAARVWRGRRLEAGMFEVLPGGASPASPL